MTNGVKHIGEMLNNHPDWLNKKCDSLNKLTYQTDPSNEINNSLNNSSEFVKQIRLVGSTI